MRCMCPSTYFSSTTSVFRFDHIAGITLSFHRYECTQMIDFRKRSNSKQARTLSGALWTRIMNIWAPSGALWTRIRPFNAVPIMQTAAAVFESGHPTAMRAHEYHPHIWAPFGRRRHRHRRLRLQRVAGSHFAFGSEHIIDSVALIARRLLVLCVCCHLCVGSFVAFLGQCRHCRYHRCSFFVSYAVQTAINSNANMRACLARCTRQRHHHYHHTKFIRPHRRMIIKYFVNSDRCVCRFCACESYMYMYLCVLCLSCVSMCLRSGFPITQPSECRRRHRQHACLCVHSLLLKTHTHRYTHSSNRARSQHVGRRYNWEKIEQKLFVWMKRTTEAANNIHTHQCVRYSHMIVQIQCVCVVDARSKSLSARECNEISIEIHRLCIATRWTRFSNIVGTSHVSRCYRHPIHSSHFDRRHFLCLFNKSKYQSTYLRNVRKHQISYHACTITHHQDTHTHWWLHSIGNPIPSLSLRADIAALSESRR